MKKDIFQLNLSSEGMDSGSNSADTFFNIRLPNKRTDYNKYVLYVDNFVVDTLDLGNMIYCVRINCYQPNSYNSTINGNNDIIAMVIQPNLATDRTIDGALQYSAPTTPIYIDTLPDQLQFKITNASNSTPLDFATNSNMWSIRLRIEAHYGEGCGCE